MLSWVTAWYENFCHGPAIGRAPREREGPLLKKELLIDFQYKNKQNGFRLNRILRTNHDTLMTENVRFRLNRVWEIRI